LAKWADQPWEKKEVKMEKQLVKACRMHAEGELERAKTNIMVYMHQAVGIGEHSDIVEAIQNELDTMAAATDRLDMLNTHFAE
jgi:hypothetical protein|tara:strand:- start:168 stop:416 length:249 start_codon:yes stop_codon:yes gene_type:complete